MAKKSKPRKKALVKPASQQGRKVAAKKVAAKKVVAKKPTAKVVAPVKKKTIAKKAAVKSVVKKAAVKKPVTKKVAAKKIVKKVIAAKAAVKKAPAKKAAAVKKPARVKAKPVALPVKKTRNIKPIELPPQAELPPVVEFPEDLVIKAANSSSPMMAPDDELHTPPVTPDPLTTFDKNVFNKATAKGDPHNRMQLSSKPKNAIKPSGKKPLW